MKDKLVMIVTIILVLTCFVGASCQAAQGAGDVQVVSHSSFHNSLNVLYVVGELENTGDVATEFTKVNATFYDSENQLIASKIGYSTLDVLLAGRKSPFTVMLLDEDGALDVHNYTLSVSWSAYEQEKPVGLEILSSVDSVDFLDCLHVTGEIKNIGTQDATAVMVVATFYDSTGTVVGRTWENAEPSDLAPNETGTFDVELIYAEQIEKVATYTLTAESENYAVIPEFPAWTTMVAVLAIASLAAVAYKKKLKTQ